MDEARHFETLTHLYRTLGHDPLGIRDMPELLRYYHRLRQGDRVDWVWGILISDIIGKHFYRELGPKQARPDPLFGGLTTRILQDESRHLAFAEHYLKRNLPGLSPERRRAMVDMRDELMRLLASMTRRVREDALAFDVEIEDFLEDVGAEIDSVARRVGLIERRGRPPMPGGGTALASGENGSLQTSVSAATDDNVIARCCGCLLSLMCVRRLATA
jgi:hypothetical protein